MKKIQITIERLQLQLKAILWIFCYKKWIGLVNVKKSLTSMFLNKSTQKNWEKIKNIEPKSEASNISGSLLSRII